MWQLNWKLGSLVSLGLRVIAGKSMWEEGSSTWRSSRVNKKLHMELNDSRNRIWIFNSSKWNQIGGAKKSNSNAIPKLNKENITFNLDKKISTASSNRWRIAGTELVSSLWPVGVEATSIRSDVYSMPIPRNFHLLHFTRQEFKIRLFLSLSAVRMDDFTISQMKNFLLSRDHIFLVCWFLDVASGARKRSERWTYWTEGKTTYYSYLMENFNISFSSGLSISPFFHFIFVILISRAPY